MMMIKLKSRKGSESYISRAERPHIRILRIKITLGGSFFYDTDLRRSQALILPDRTAKKIATQIQKENKYLEIRLLRICINKESK